MLAMKSGQQGRKMNNNLKIPKLNYDANQQMGHEESANSLQKIPKNFSSSQKNNPKQQKDKIEEIQKKKKFKSFQHIKEINSLERVIKKQKVKNIQTIFINKIMRNSTQSSPVEYKKFESWDRSGFSNIKGFELPSYIYTGLYLLSVFQILALAYLYSLSLVFHGVDGILLSNLQTASLIFYFVEIIIHLISVKISGDKKLKYLSEIFHYYFKHTLIIDFLSLLILFLDIFTNWEVIYYLRLIILFKLPQCLEKIQKLEVYFNQNVYHEQYWNLVKVFIYNLTYCHIIALLLGGMVIFNQSQSWMVAKGIDHSSWNVQYAWSYYWAGQIMLSIGFGDLVAMNYQEAVCIGFIELLGCFMVAYNISTMGNIIVKLRSIDQQRYKKCRTFKKLTDNNQLSDNLVFQIDNYIEQSSKLKKEFNCEEDKQFIDDLPSTLKGNYLREAHKGILCQLVFFRGLLDNTL